MNRREFIETMGWSVAAAGLLPAAGYAGETAKAVSRPSEASSTPAVDKGVDPRTATERAGRTYLGWETVDGHKHGAVIDSQGRRKEDRSNRFSIAGCDFKSTGGIFNMTFDYIVEPKVKLFAYGNPDIYTPTPPHNPLYNGILFFMPWSLLNPQKGQYRWDRLDRLLDACDGEKEIGLLLLNSTWRPRRYVEEQGLQPATPTWIYDHGVPSFTYTNHRRNIKIKNPVLWSAQFESIYNEFLEALGEHCRKNRRITFQYVATGINGETFLYPPDFDDKVQSQIGLPLAECQKRFHGHADRIVETYARIFGPIQKLVCRIGSLQRTDMIHGCNPSFWYGSRNFNALAAQNKILQGLLEKGKEIPPQMRAAYMEEFGPFTYFQGTIDGQRKDQGTWFQPFEQVRQIVAAMNPQYINTFIYWRVLLKRGLQLMGYDAPFENEYETTSWNIYSQPHGRAFKDSQVFLKRWGFASLDDYLFRMAQDFQSYQNLTEYRARAQWDAGGFLDVGQVQIEFVEDWLRVGPPDCTVFNYPLRRLTGLAGQTEAQVSQKLFKCPPAELRGWAFQTETNK